MLDTFTKLNLGASIEELQPDWLGISLWEGNKDFVNVDNLQKYTPTGGFAFYYDLTQPLPFEDNSIEIIFSSHFIEHIHLIEAQQLIRESYRILKPGGIIRFITPDMDIWIDKLYNKDIDFFQKYQEIITKHFGEWHEFAQLNTPLQMLNCMLFAWGHKWMWDFETLEKEFSKVGFKNIKKKNYLESNISDINNIENCLPSKLIENRNMESLFIEAVKNKTNSKLL